MQLLLVHARYCIHFVALPTNIDQVGADCLLLACMCQLQPFLATIVMAQGRAAASRWFMHRQQGAKLTSTNPKPHTRVRTMLSRLKMTRRLLKELLNGSV